MNICKFDLLQTPIGNAKLILEVDVPVSELSEVYSKYEGGMPLKVELKKVTKKRSLDQNSLLWRNIGRISQSLYITKEDVYHELLRKYGAFTPMDVLKVALPDLRGLFGYIEVIDEKDQDTVSILAYKSIKYMTSDEASRLIDGSISDMEEMGIYDDGN